MRVLITGNMGYVGSVLVPMLARTNQIELVGLDTGFFGHCLTGSGLLPEAHLAQQVFKDVRFIQIEDLSGIDCVVHLAALSNDPMGNSFQELTHEINLKSSQSLVKLCREAGVKKFVFASSCSVYGSGGANIKDENSSLDPLTAYARSKISFEEILSDESREDFECISLRFSTACGPSPRLRVDLVLNDFVLNAVQTGVIKVLSDGTPIRPLIDVRDMANSIRWSIISKQAQQYTCYNVGRPASNFTVAEIAHTVARCFENVTVEVSKDAQPDKRSYAVSFEKFTAATGGKVLKHDLESSILGLRAQISNHSPLELNEMKRLTTLKANIKLRQIDKNLELVNAL